MLRKDIHHIRRQDERAYRGFRLWLGNQRLCAFLYDLSPDVKLACIKVDIFPLKTKYFPTAHARGQFEEEEFVISFLVRLYQKPLDLFLRQHLHFFCLFGRQFTAHGRI